MKHSWLKSAAVVAGVIFGANGSFAAGNDWTYYAAGAEGNPTGGGLTNCIQKGDWTIEALSYDAAEGCFGVWESAAGVRKAWMVHLAQDTDPKGFCIRVQ